jgi:dihydroxy-acid dehydratase
MNQRSKEILTRPRWSKVRGLYKSMGFTDEDLERPLIGIANSWSNIVPGHTNLRNVADYVRDGILRGGGTPLEFGVLGVCDGIANGHEGMKYSLPSRDLIASSIESMAEAHRLDGLILLGSCDKSVPGLLMAAARLDLPTLIVVGGASAGGMLFDNKASDITSISEALGMLKANIISEEQYFELEEKAMPTCGSCSFLGTANSMCCLCEALGITLPGTSTIPAYYSERFRSSKEAGIRIVQMVKQGISARKLINKDSIENAIILGSAIGASTNMVLHIAAVAYEADVPFNLENFERISQNTPLITKINPSSKYNIEDLHRAGGIPAIMKKLFDLLHIDCLNGTGEPWKKYLPKVPDGNKEIIRSVKKPWSTNGGLAVLKGNIAPNGGITKPAAIPEELSYFKGNAKCFNSEEDCNKAILDGIIREGDVVVIRYEGPKGGPGMREMSTAIKLLYGRGLSKTTAVITDGRFSGTSHGCFVGHISPEAADGGLIAVINDGDSIVIDIQNRTISLEVLESETKKRFETWISPKVPTEKGWLGTYTRLTAPSERGASIQGTKINRP